MMMTSGPKGQRFSVAEAQKFYKKGQLVMVLHEFVHILLAQQNKPWQNSDLINNEDYRWSLEDVFGKQSDEFYDMMRWAGCTLSPEFLALPYDDRRRIGKFLEDTLQKESN